MQPFCHIGHLQSTRLILGSEMNRLDFRQQDKTALLRVLRNQLFKMVGLVEQQLRLVIQGFKHQSANSLDDVFQLSYKIDKMHLLIHDECELVAAQQLDNQQQSRLLIVLVRSMDLLQAVVNQNEKLCRMFKDLMDLGFQSHFYQELAFFGEKVYRMLSSVFDALARVDIKQAVKMVELDQEINAHFEELDHYVVKQMMTQPAQIKALLYLSHCAKALERIADHAKKISGLTIFLRQDKRDIEQIEQLP